MTNREVRFTPVDLELRTEEGRSLPTIYGYSAVFNSLSDDLGGFRERIQPSAFNKTLQERSDAIKAFHNHNPDIVIGSTRKNTLELSTDDHGLAHRIQPPDNAWGRPVVDAIERGDIEGMSFGFSLGSRKDEHDPDNPSVRWQQDGDVAIRDLLEVRLYEVSTVSSWPAYPATTVGVRALAEELSVEDTELRDAFAVLAQPDGTLTDEQHQLLMRAITLRYSNHYIAPEVSRAQQMLAQHEARWMAEGTMPEAAPEPEPAESPAE